MKAHLEVVWEIFVALPSGRPLIQHLLALFEHRYCILLIFFGDLAFVRGDSQSGIVTDRPAFRCNRFKLTSNGGLAGRASDVRRIRTCFRSH